MMADAEALIDRALPYAGDVRGRRAARAAFDQLADRPPRRLASLVESLRPSPDPDKRALAAMLLGRLAKDDPEQAERLLLELANDVDEQVTANAAEQLKQVPGSKATAALSRVARHSDPRVRRGAAIGLYGRNSRPALLALRQLVEDSDKEVRDWAAWALADVDRPSRLQRAGLRSWLARSDEIENQLRQHVLISLVRSLKEGRRSPRVQTVRTGRRWSNRVAGSTTALATHSTKAEAVAEARQLAKDLGGRHSVASPAKRRRLTRSN